MRAARHGGHHEEPPVVIYGTPVSLGDVTYSVNPLKLIVPEPGRSEFLAGRSDTTAATLENLPESQVTITIEHSSAGSSGSGTPVS